MPFAPGEPIVRCVLTGAEAPARILPMQSRAEVGSGPQVPEQIRPISEK
jgi:hypothetical protein